MSSAANLQFKTSRPDARAGHGSSAAVADHGEQTGQTAPSSLRSLGLGIDPINLSPIIDFWLWSSYLVCSDLDPLLPLPIVALLPGIRFGSGDLDSFRYRTCPKLSRLSSSDIPIVPAHPPRPRVPAGLPPPCDRC
jgi:hypothetical protein